MKFIHIGRELAFGLFSFTVARLAVEAVEAGPVSSD